MLLILAVCIIEEVSSDSDANQATLISEALKEAPSRWNPRTLRLLFLDGRSSRPCFLLRDAIEREREQTDAFPGARAANQGVLGDERQAQPDEGAVQAGDDAESALIPHCPDCPAGKRDDRAADAAT
jgi:hypothetical protein